MNSSKRLDTHDAGYVMKCISSNSHNFIVGKHYPTERCTITDYNQGCPDINGGFALNYQRGKYYGVEGATMIARFIMVKDNKGRYTKRDTCRKLKEKQDFRRMRRYIRQMLKTSERGSYEFKILNSLARRLGK
ncbi:hypothetical protein bas09_0077 [Changchunvirus paulsarasin]|uniref:Uncharacterized protein n=1 Tax=Escherichia phage PaulSarasin TaxID=2851973 RepID=A0AAE7VXE6_9CAUD|nr:hypothetical protein bas09_0077 [Escherichia phage PaulSarasin]